MSDLRRWTDADFYRAYLAGHFDDLRFNAFAPGECRCEDRAWAHASATQQPEHGQVTPEEVRFCRQPSTWCRGRVVLSCSNTATLSDALSDAGFIGDEAQDAELLRRLEAAERAEEAGAKVLDFGLKTLGLEPAPDIPPRPSLKHPESCSTQATPPLPLRRQGGRCAT